ncbi:AAA family ATPase [Panacagrimonas sp.]|uniref:ExeA family protein n=1 Tax=Panacagrimonas sp. TaxID=2480088 RepID=UPI003B52F41A
MYAQYFNLREMPFSITPDPAYLYMSPRHQEALGHLLFGTGQYGGFVQLTGEVGTGKTTVVRTLLEQQLDGVEVAMLHNPRQSEQEFVQSICDELRVPYAREPAAPTLKDLIDALNRHLLANHAAGKRTVVIIDEAQNLSPGVLEQVRLLTNLETHKEKLLRVMLVGQPELSELLARPELRQLASRITARYHLTPLAEDETAEYIRHRLNVAGSQEMLFPPEAVAEVQRRTHGVPRLINVLCDRALLGAYAAQLRAVTPELVTGAAEEVLGNTRARRPRDLAESGGLWEQLDRRIGSRLPQISVSPLEGLLIAVAFMIGGALLYQTLVNWSFSEAPPAADGAVTAISAPPSAGASAPAPDEVATAAPATPPAIAPPSAPEVARPSIPPAAAEPSPLDPAALERLLARNTTLAQLTNRLIRLWDSGIRVPRNANVCRSLRAQGLECYRTNGSLKDLRQMDRPAILTLTDDDGDKRHLLIAQLTEDRARFDTADGLVDVALDDLRLAWTGEMFLLWRRETRQVQLAPGQRGPDIVWLRERLGEMMGKPVSRSDRYDASLKEEVRLFQEARDLIADGVVGIRSRIALSDPAPGTPTLSFRP